MENKIAKLFSKVSEAINLVGPVHRNAKAPVNGTGCYGSADDWWVFGIGKSIAMRFAAVGHDHACLYRPVSVL